MQRGIDGEELNLLNIFRTANGKGSPKILVGSINLGGLNFHTEKMIEMGASIVSISLDKADKDGSRPDRLYVDPFKPLKESLVNLPNGWEPDFFWDSQVEHGHFIPPGLSEVDFPTIASFNHAHLGQALLHLQGMFDCLIRPSTLCPWGDAYLPWGASWGTMSRRLQMLDVERNPDGERPIDVSCTIGTGPIGKESMRFRTLEQLREIKASRPDLTIEITSGLSVEEYFNVLARSKASINVGAWGCTMTYRPLEVIAQGCALIHVDETAYGSTSTLSEFFPATWYTKAEPDLYSLELAIDTALRKTRAEKLHIEEELESIYSYEKQNERLFELARTVKRGERMSAVDFSRRAGAIMATTGYHMHLDPHLWALTPKDCQSSLKYPEGDWDVCLWMPDDPEIKYRMQTELALRKEDPKAVYRRASQASIKQQ